MSNWRAMREPVAPKARRMASSFCRAAPRARSKLATFTQAMSSTNPTAASKAVNVVRRVFIPNSLMGITVAPMPTSSLGYCSRMRAPMASISARACATPTPGFKRAIQMKLFSSRP